MRIPLREYWRLLVAYLRPQWPRVALLAALLLSSIALQLVNPQLIRHFIDTAQAGGPPRDLALAAGLFMALALAQQGLAVSATYVGEGVGWTATNQLRADLALHVLRLDLAFHKARTPGELIERIDGDVTALGNFFSQFVILIVGNGLLMLGVLALLYREDWRVGVGLTLFALVALTVLLRVRALAIPFWLAFREMSARFFGVLGEHLAATEDVRALGARPHVMRRFYALWREWLPIQRRMYFAGYSSWLVSIAVFGVGTAFAFGLGAYLWGLGAITVGAVYLIYHYTELLRQPMEQIRIQLQELQQASAGLERVRALLDTRPALEDNGRGELSAGPLAVAFREVTFAYDAAEPVLHGLSFDLAPGQVLGLLGRTGSGKTTVARLLLRLYDAGAGQVCLDGRPLRDLRLSEVRRRVGLVTQDVQLFHATLRDNLTFFNRAIPDERLLRVLDDLGLGAWLAGLPAGLDSGLPSDGAGLSAGEAQLVAFARLFLKDPGLVILDEASSRLDPATERLIERAVDRLLAGRTAVIIAHRLATVQRADQIMVLEGGRLVEFGPRLALAADPASRFSRLLRTGLQEALA
jgi:ABC-type multidrug transport system fused ATPase/permease subunit